MMIKKKHKCSNNLIVDLLKFLTSLKVPHVPTSWQKLTTIIKTMGGLPKGNEKMIDSTVYFCPQCERESMNSNKCTNECCSFFIHTLIPPHKFLIMNVQQQLEQILKSIDRNDLHLATQPDEYSMMTDVQHGEVYSNIIHSLQHEHHESFLSLTCNIDGAVVYTSSEQSVWTFIACVNEIRRSSRFHVDKIIGKNRILTYFYHLFSLTLVLGISIGRKKPSKSIVQKMLHPIVLRLKELQKPIL